MMSTSDSNGNNFNAPKFARQSKDNTSIWAAVFEKALAKMKGIYIGNTELVGDDETFTYITGMPVYYWAITPNNQYGYNPTFNYL